MKRVIFLTVALVVVILSPVTLLAQQRTVAVAGFEVQGGVTPEEAAVVTELFITSLVSTGRVNVIDRTNFDAILAEMRFQTTDWSNRERTASLGRVLNAQNVIRGQLMKMGDQIFWTATVLDVNTAQVLSSSRQQLKNLDEIWGNNLTSFSQQVVSLLPVPNLFVGRWECSNYNPVSGEESIKCIIEIKVDGSIIIERYDTYTETVYVTRRILSDNSYRSIYSSNRGGRGTGTYKAVIRTGDSIEIEVTLNLIGLPQVFPTQQTGKFSLSINSPNGFRNQTGALLEKKEYIYYENGKFDTRFVYRSERHENFRRLQ